MHPRRDTGVLFFEIRRWDREKRRASVACGRCLENREDLLLYFEVKLVILDLF